MALFFQRGKHSIFAVISNSNENPLYRAEYPLYRVEWIHTQELIWKYHGGLCIHGTHMGTETWSWIRCKARRGVMGRALCSTLPHRVIASDFGGKCDTMFKQFPPSRNMDRVPWPKFFTFTENKSNPHGTYLITVICNFERNSQLQRKITLNLARALMALKKMVSFQKPNISRKVQSGPTDSRKSESGWLTIG